MGQAAHIGHGLEILALHVLQMPDLLLLISDLLAQRADDAFREDFHGLVGGVGGDAVDIGLVLPPARPCAYQSAKPTTTDESENQRRPEFHGAE